MPITGVAIRGDGRGRALGFPTANLKVETSPNSGVYACWAWIKGNKKKHQAVLHVGPRPVFNDPKATVELHILDFIDKDLYGKTLTFEIVAKIRDVEHFTSVDELIQAIQNDCDKARLLLPV